MPSSALKQGALPMLTLTRRRVVLIAAVAAVLLLLASSDALHGRLLEAVTWGSVLVATHPILGACAFLLLSAVSVMLTFFSSGLLVPIALVTWGAPATFLLLWTGWILGGVCAYTISRFVGRRVVSALTSGDALDYGDRLSSNTPFRYVLLFQLAVPSEIPGYIMGLLRYRFRAYLAAVTIGELPYAIATVALGDSLLQQRVVLLVVLGALLIAFSSWALHQLRRRIV